MTLWLDFVLSSFDMSMFSEELHFKIILTNFSLIHFIFFIFSGHFYFFQINFILILWNLTTEQLSSGWTFTCDFIGFVCMARNTLNIAKKTE